MATNQAPARPGGGETHEKAYTPGTRGLTLHDVLLRLWQGQGARTEQELIDGTDAILANKVGLRGHREYRLLVDAEQAVAKGGDLSGLDDEELLDRVAQGEPAAIAEFRLRRGRKMAAEAEARASRTPEQRAAEMAARSEDELYQLALTDPDARVELQRRHTEAGPTSPASRPAAPTAPTREGA